MEATSLQEVYASVNRDAERIFVVPLIRYSHKKSDYLYLLYEDLIKEEHYKIKTISVLDHFKLLAGIISNRNTILHYHWLEFQDFKSLLGMPWKITCIYLFHQLGGKIVWTLHNEFPHDQKYLSFHRYLHKKMARWADILHVHCQTAIGTMSSRLEAPEEKFRVIPHPEFPADLVPKSQAFDNLNEYFNTDLNEDTPVLLMFGNISRYKQIEKVAELITGLETDCKLLVVGPVKKGNLKLYKELKELEEKNSRIKLIPKFIPEEQVPWFYSAADICVFNYREILSSGGYHMAKAYHKTIIAPDLGCLSEEIDRDDVFLFHSENELRTLLNRQIIAHKNG